MVAALTVSAVFLACYLVYHALIGGGTPFPGLGVPRVIYFTILISHVVLAAADRAADLDHRQPGDSQAV